jgi:hypothetical protein
MPGSGSSILDTGCSILDTGCSMLDSGYSMLDSGYKKSDSVVQLLMDLVIFRFQWQSGTAYKIELVVR